VNDLKNGEPYISIWFGHFFRPAYDSREFVSQEIRELKRLGFNTVLQDAKEWEDIAERVKSGRKSQYVEMLEYMQQELKKNGMSHAFLALYLNGDNLYPDIRFSPPVFGESVTGENGEDGRWYKYWSDRAKSSMVSHVKGLLETYADNISRAETDNGMVRPVCSMWDPIVSPSFDREGEDRYRGWLKLRYEGSVDRLNEAYQTEFSSFEEIPRETYRFELHFPGEVLHEEDFRTCSPKCRIWCDNQKWKISELTAYFRDMNRRLKKEAGDDLFLCPNLAQWSYFLNIDGTMLKDVGMSDLWDTAVRGIDPYQISPYVDSSHFTAVPVTPDGDPDPYVVSCQHSMMRPMNEGRENIGGIFWGRFLYNDIYEYLTPCEVLGSMAANGISGYSSYGVCGMDDGGLLERMPDSFKESLRTANDWCKKVIPLLKKRKKKAAILFPSVMAAFETLCVEGNKERRTDLLGWFRLCCDSGCEADIISADMVRKGKLKDYEILIVAADDCYHLEPDRKAEEEIRCFAERGGIVFHGPYGTAAVNAFHIQGKPHGKDVICAGEKVMASGSCFMSYEGEKIAVFAGDGAGAVVKNAAGKGCVFSFGFLYGCSYCVKKLPHVPRQEKNNALYPVSLMKKPFFAALLDSCQVSRHKTARKDLEVAEFENGYVIVNHSSVPAEIGETGRDFISQYPIVNGFLLPRSAVFIKKRV